MRSTLLLIFVLASAFGIYRVASDPYRTALPLEVEDLSPIEPQLARLPPDDAELVRDYLARSNGDVLPAQFADPDNPLTARTFAQAIELEKAHREKMKLERARIAAFQAERDAQYQPLRAAVAVRLVKREALTLAEVYGTPSPAGAAKSALDPRAEERMTVLSYRFTNRSGRTIDAFRGVVQIAGSGLMPAASCVVDRTEPLDAGASHEIRCRTPPDANAEDVARVNAPIASIALAWQPYEVRFADGEVLKGPP
jgi:hypothetical protein